MYNKLKTIISLRCSNRQTKALASVVFFTLSHSKYHYSLSCKSVNTRENFWTVYCFTTNQVRDETTKVKEQTTAGISHNLIRNKKLALSCTRNLQFNLYISLKKLFLPQTNTSHLIPSVQKRNGTGSCPFLSYKTYR